MCVQPGRDGEGEGGSERAGQSVWINAVYNYRPVRTSYAERFAGVLWKMFYCLHGGNKLSGN